MSLGAKWMTIPGARPHWGKQWAFLPNIEDHIRKVRHYNKTTEWIQSIAISMFNVGLFAIPINETSHVEIVRFLQIKKRRVITCLIIILFVPKLANTT